VEIVIAHREAGRLSEPPLTIGAQRTDAATKRIGVTKTAV